MSEFASLREAVDSIASRRPSPDFGELKRQATRRGRRRVVMVGAATAAVIAAATLATAGLDDDRRTAPVEQPKPSSGATNGWVAVDAWQGGGEIHLVRPGQNARRLEVAGSDAATEACPAWSPDGQRLLFGRVTGSSDTGSGAAELVIVPIGRNGAAGTPTVIGLDGFEVLDGFDVHPCGIWSPDGRWVAFAGTGEVWVVDTQTEAVVRLANLRPSDLEWRPGTDQLAIAGDLGTNRAAPTLSTPVAIYSVSTGELHQLDSVEAGHITWSPDGTTLAYSSGEADNPTLRLVDADGTNERSLVDELGVANHGIGPVWSPTGDRIAYQRLAATSGESHEVVLVNVANGTETVIEPPETDGRVWYPFTVSWSPDGTTLLYAAWTVDGRAAPGGVIAVSADEPQSVTVLTDAIDPVPDYYSHQWAAIQMWGRQSG